VRDWGESVALVTGAGSGIGRAIALALAERGAGVVLVGRREAPLEEVARAAPATSAGVRVLPADLTDDEQVEGLRSTLEGNGGRLDVLVHCAGVISHGAIEHADVADLDAQYRTNLRAPYLLSQALLPMLVAHEGEVVFINSTITGRAGAGTGPYAATKSALKAIADSLRQEVNTSGIRVLSVYPGRTATPGQAHLHAMEGRDYRPEDLMQPEDVASMLISALELPRSAEVTEISMRPFLKPPG
jgi:NADP-dependent 3-hydroxy acid dehydrogenase YdfG